MKTNYHTHHELCRHAYGKTEDYVKKAIQLKFTELGMSDHGPILKDFMDEASYQISNCDLRMSYEEYKHIYLEELNVIQKKYSHQIKLLKAVEIEYIESHDDYYKSLIEDLDYLALGVHYFFYQGNYYNTFRGLNHQTIYGYAENIEKALDTKLFKILVHPDLFMFNYQSELNGMHYFDHHAEIVSKRIIEAAIRNDVLLEINARGIQRHVNTMNDINSYYYPNAHFFKLVKDYTNAKIIVSADAHHPNDLDGPHIEAAYHFAQALNLNIEAYMKR
jgi:histidinol-phosphatase (PHP family)